MTLPGLYRILQNKNQTFFILWLGLGLVYQYLLLQYH